MWELIAGSILGLRLNFLPKIQPDLLPLEAFAWSETTIFQLPELEQDSLLEAKIVAYLHNLMTQGFKQNRQGIWLQSDWSTLGSNQGTTPMPGASLTKIATTLAALHKWGAQHQFLTDIYVIGEINQGVVEGDLLVQGGGDPLFVWEEAIALGNALNQLGIRKIEGDLLVSDQFHLNFQAQSVAAGKLLQQAIDHNKWQQAVRQQYRQMPRGTKLPEVVVTGGVKRIEQVPPTGRLLIRHRSLPLAVILKQMNLYSNNYMAQILADLVGGVEQIMIVGQSLAGVSPEEIELVNGSGLGEANLISPRAACQMLMAIARLLGSDNLNLIDVLPTAGRDTMGTIQGRNLPPGTAIKTGTLDRVSALAGAIPTSDRGTVFFSIINYGAQVEQFRQQQDSLLQQLSQPWQLSSPQTSPIAKNSWYLGDPRRNILKKLD